MRFRNYGGSHQFVVATEADLARIDDLDPARWAATSAPLRDLHCDTKFLAAIDPDGTGRVRVSQLVAARDWAFARLGRRELLRERTEEIPITAIDAKDDGGKALRAAAERVNDQQKAADPNKITLADVRAFQGGYGKLLANGDGVLPPDIVPDADVAALLRDVITVLGGSADRGGSEGVSLEKLTAYREGGATYLAWRARAAESAPWGDATSGAWDLVDGLSPAIDAYFLRAELLRQQSAAREAVRLDPDALRALYQRDAIDVEKHLRDAPVAPPDPAGTLDLAGPFNALYEARMVRLRDEVVPRALGAGTTKLTRESWERVRAVFAGYAAWRKEAPSAPWEKIGDEKLRAQLEGALPGKAAEFIALDAAAAPEIARVDELEKLLLHVRWLIDLANNLVNFSAIYRKDEAALCESGSLVIDGRRLDFCLRVHERGAHRPVAAESLCFLVYAKITAKEAGGEAFEVVAPVTGGERGRLRVGKRGIFLDVHGKEFDAQIVDVVENPISVREAAFAPFRRAAKFIGDKIEEWVGSHADAQQRSLQESTSARMTEARATADGAVAGTVTTSTTPGATTTTTTIPPAPPKEGLNINALVIGGGVALAGVSAVIASLFGALTTLRGWAALTGLVLVVLGVSALAGWFKLRRRDLSALLEAAGWAVNARMKVTRRVAQVFAYVPALPKDARIERGEALPRAKGEGRGRLVLLLTLLAATSAFGYWAWLHGWMRY